MELRTLLIMDAGNYGPGMEELVRTAVRGVIFLGDKLLLIQDSCGAMKLPGGGRDPGETDIDTLAREVLEETGYRVIRETVRPFGSIEEKRRSLHEDMIWHQYNNLYFCQVEEEPGECSYSGNEKKLGMHLRACTLEEALEISRATLEREGKQAWNQREYRTLTLIKEYLDEKK